MSATSGLNHLGLSVRNLDETTAFFTEVLGWSEVARDDSYPRNAVTDGKLRLTLWQVDPTLNGADFDRRANVGLHHIALQIDTSEALDIIAEPGGLRIELTWPGS